MGPYWFCNVNTLDFRKKNVKLLPARFITTVPDRVGAEPWWNMG